MKKVLKWIGYILLTLILGVGCYIAIYLLYHKDIPLTSPNVNNLPLGEVSISKTKLQNGWGDEMDVEQGKIVVSENRTKEGSNHISINFIRIPTTNPQPKSPIFFLAGGPGTPGSDVGRREYFYVFKKLSEQADVVLIDQRGTGTSIPNLRCRNSVDLPKKSPENWEYDILNKIVKRCGECADEFRELGIDLSGYNSRESAKDIDQIRNALNMDKITLFGYSYGTTLAQHYISLYDDNVDKLIFAGTTAPDLDLKLPSQMEVQYEIMDSLIASDKKMSRYIPSFTQLMLDQNNKLKTSPLKIKLPLMDAVGDDDGWFLNTVFKTIALFKPYWELTLSDTHMKMMMAQNSGRDGWTRIAPRYYYQLSQGEHQRLGNYFRNFRRQNLPNALFFTVTAATNYSADRWDLASEMRENALVSHFDVSFARFPEVLDAFDVPVIEGLNEPVYSDKKLLLIAGTLDGRTPMANTDSVYNRFSNANKIVVHNASHNDLIDSRVLDKIMEFIVDTPLENIELKRKFTFLPPVSFHHHVIDSLESIRKSAGLEKALEKFVELRLKYIDQEDYYFDISESSLNNYGYQFLNDGLVDEAVKVFELNTLLFPESANVYNSMAEGLLAKGEIQKAVYNLEKAIQINYLDGYSHALKRKYQ